MIEVTRIPTPAMPFPVLAYVAVEGGGFVGAGGLAWFNDRCWLWFGAEASDVDPGHPVRVVRWARRMLSKAKQLGETEVFVHRDASKASSERLLALLGFHYVAVEHEKELWKWQH